MEIGDSYLKHRTYLDNVPATFPEIKWACDDKYIELNFPQNLALRPKDEDHLDHFSGKQSTLHCAIVNPVKFRYHFHLSDDIYS